MQNAATPDLFAFVVQKACPFGLIFILTMFAPEVLRRVGPFKELIATIKLYNDKIVTIGSFSEPVRCFEYGGEGNRTIAAYYKAKVLEGRLQTELDDLFRSCCGWLLVHLIIVVVVTATVSQSLNGISAEHLKVVSILGGMLSLPVAETLVALFCMMSLQRLAREWRDIAPNLG